MKNIKWSLFFLFLNLTIQSIAQNAAFEAKALRIVNLQSVNVAAEGDLYLSVAHRFGSTKIGSSDFWSLDDSNTKFQLDYGLFDGLQMGLSWESLSKNYAGSAKMTLMEQTEEFPLSMAAYGIITLNTELSKDRYPNMKFADRLSYVSQLLIARQLTRKVFLEIAPTFIRQNLVLEPFQNHNQFALGFGGQFKISEQISINADYVHNLGRAEQSIYNDFFSIGLGFEIKKYLFQLLWSNGLSTNEPGFMSNAEGSWNDGEVFLGLNIVRVF